jgi:flagellar hook capping protein FlgD
MLLASVHGGPGAAAANGGAAFGTPKQQTKEETMNVRMQQLVTGAMVALALSSLALVGTARATVTAVPVARQGNPAPGGNGTFGPYANYGEPCLNDHSQVAFSALLTGTSGGGADNDVLVRGEANGSVTLMAREGQPIPDGPGSFGALHFVIREYAMNDSGRIAVVAPLTGTPGGTSDNSALYSAITPGLWWKHIRRGDIAPFTTLPFNGIFPPQINDQPPAAVAFLASLGTSSLPSVVYVSRLGLLSPISWVTQAAPDASSGSGFNGSVFSYPAADPPALRRNAAEVAIWAHMSGTQLAFRDDDGVFRASADGFADCARGNQAAPGGGTYGEMDSPVYNADGIAAFRSPLYPSSAGEIIALDWPAGGELCAFKGQSAADGNGTFASLGEPALNDAETVAFRVSLTGTSGGGNDDSAIYKSDSPYTAVPSLDDQLAREDQAPPEGNGKFSGFGSFVATNALGQVLFTATLKSTSGGSSDNRGLYLWDPVDGLVKLLRLGDAIEGRTVIDFSTLTERDFGGYRVLNDVGEAVARVRFYFSPGGGDGVYIFRYQRTVGVEHEPRVSSLQLAVGPNPMAAGPVTLRYALPAAGTLRATAHDLSGRLVRTIHDGVAEAAGTLAWDGADDAGRTVPAGVYFIRVAAAGQQLVRRLVRVR